MHNPQSDFNRVIFEKPDSKELSKEGYMCIDMHLHSRYSDGSATVKKIMEKAKKNGFGISLTDHNTIKGNLEAQKLASKKSPVIPGIEVNCNNGRDILLYFYESSDLEEFYKKHINDFKGLLDPSGKSKVEMCELLDEVKSLNCVVSAAHPFGLAHKNLHRYLKKHDCFDYVDKLDAIEIMNGEMSRKINKNAIVWNFNINKGYTGGSDGHTLREIGDVLTCSKADTYQEFLDNIRKKKNFVIGKEASTNKKAMAYPAIFRKHLPYFHPKLLHSVGKNKLIKGILRINKETETTNSK
jgi:predicted metal-dependent phosphoesterase TrpH